MKERPADGDSGGPAKPTSYLAAVEGDSSATASLSLVTRVDSVNPRFLETAKSVLSQSLSGTEWLVIDATGRGAELATALKDLETPAGTRVRLLPGVGAGFAARLAGLRQSSGEYIGFLDAGIVLAPTYCEKCVWLLDAQPGFVFCNSESRVAEGETPQGYHRLESATAHAVRTVGAASGTVFRRSAVEKLMLSGERDNHGLEFEAVLLSLAHNGQWGFSIPEDLRSGSTESPEPSGSKENDRDLLLQFMRQRYPALLSRLPQARWTEWSPYAPLRSSFAAPRIVRPPKRGRAILLVVPWMVVGGADKFNLDLVEMLVGHGHSVVICATLQARHDWQKYFLVHTSDVFVMRNFLDVSDFPRFLSYLIDSRTIELVVISGSTLGYQLLPYLRANAPHVAFIDLNHIEEPDWQSGGHPRFGVGYRDLLDVNVVSTRHLAAWMASQGVERDRLRVLRTGVEEPTEETVRSDRRSVRAELGLSEDLPVIIFGGRLTPQKRPDVLARILARLAERRIEFHALIVGDGEVRAEFESLVIQLQTHPSVSCFGAVSHDRWLGLLHAADIFLMPSAHEGISIALLEALAAGVVPVVSDVGGQNEVVSEESGFLIPLSDGEVDQYAGTLARLIGSGELRAQMGKAGRLLIRHEFSREATFNQFERIMSEALESPGKSSRSGLLPNSLAIELATSALEMERLNRTIVRLHEHASGDPGGLPASVRRWMRRFAESRPGQALRPRSLVRRLKAGKRPRD